MFHLYLLLYHYFVSGHIITSQSLFHIYLLLHHYLSSAHAITIPVSYLFLIAPSHCISSCYDITCIISFFITPYMHIFCQPSLSQSCFMHLCLLLHYYLATANTVTIPVPPLLVIAPLPCVSSYYHIPCFISSCLPVNDTGVKHSPLC